MLGLQSRGIERLPNYSRQGNLAIVPTKTAINKNIGRRQYDPGLITARLECSTGEFPELIMRSICEIGRCDSEETQPNRFRLHLARFNEVNGLDLAPSCETQSSTQYASSTAEIFLVLFETTALEVPKAQSDLTGATPEPCCFIYIHTLSLQLFAMIVEIIVKLLKSVATLIEQ